MQIILYFFMQITNNFTLLQSIIPKIEYIIPELEEQN